jgi:hypothetical protein
MSSINYWNRILLALPFRDTWLSTLEIGNAISAEEKRAGNPKWGNIAANSTILATCKRLKREGLIECRETGWGYWHRPEWRLTDKGRAWRSRNPY